MDDEYEELIGAIIFWRGALKAQFTPDTQAFAQAQIDRLHQRADALLRDEGEIEDSECSFYCLDCPSFRFCLAEGRSCR